MKMDVGLHGWVFTPSGTAGTKGALFTRGILYFNSTFFFPPLFALEDLCSLPFPSLLVFFIYVLERIP